MTDLQTASPAAGGDKLEEGRILTVVGPVIDVDDLCHTTIVGRAPFRHRVSGLVVTDGAVEIRFFDAQGAVLYVGTSRDLRSRVRTYFTAAETRRKVLDMLPRAESIGVIECATPTEARVRELRLIAEHKPKYNRRSRFPERVHWVKVTVEPWPRLSMVRQVLDDGAEYLGPFGSKKVAERAVAALHETFPVRQCSDRFPITPTRSPSTGPTRMVHTAETVSSAPMRG